MEYRPLLELRFLYLWFTQCSVLCFFRLHVFIFLLFLLPLRLHDIFFIVIINIIIVYKHLLHLLCHFLLLFIYLFSFIYILFLPPLIMLLFSPHHILH